MGIFRLYYGRPRSEYGKQRRRQEEKELVEVLKEARKRKEVKNGEEATRQNEGQNEFDRTQNTQE